MGQRKLDVIVTKILVFLTGVLLVGLIGIADCSTGIQYSLLPFYLIPLFLVTWFAGRFAGLSIAILGSLIWFLEDAMIAKSYSIQPFSYWNIAGNLVLFLTITWILPELKDALRREKELITIDVLTGVVNRKAFYDIAHKEVCRLRRYKRPMTVAAIDIDNLKMVNYRFGHGAGDKVLQLVANTIKSNVREVDVVSRFGGDEFTLLLPETGAEAAQVVLSRLRVRLLDVMQRNERPVTFSFGVATFLVAPASVEDVIKKANILMYSAKNAGANAIEQEVFAEQKAQ